MLGGNKLFLLIMNTCSGHVIPSHPIFSLSKEELRHNVQTLGIPRFHSDQMWSWIYNKGINTIQSMTNIPKAVQKQLEDIFSLERPIVSRAQTSSDGTQKWLLRFKDGKEAETVYIPTVDRGTLCISSQVGCTLTCKFCHTGTQTLVRNLSVDEIVAQIVIAKDMLADWKRKPCERPAVTNIVMMGMGEPLYNYDNVSKALKILMDASGIHLSKRKITLSTSGVVPMIEPCGRELGVNLAVSLHAVRDDLRDILIPLNKKYPIKMLLESCRTYPALDQTRRITFEYVMLKDVNDTDADARELARILKGIPSKINLIPFNPWPGAPFECSLWSRIQTFSEILYQKGYSAPIRETRGQDILAACGQLKSDSERIRKSQVLKESA